MCLRDTAAALQPSHQQDWRCFLGGSRKACSAPAMRWPPGSASQSPSEWLWGNHSCQRTQTANHPCLLQGQTEEFFLKTFYFLWSTNKSRQTTTQVSNGQLLASPESLCIPRQSRLSLFRKLLVTQLCPILSRPIDCSPQGSSVHVILQARILEWVAMPFSRGSSQSRDWTPVSCIAGRLFTIWATREAFSS